MLLLKTGVQGFLHQARVTAGVVAMTTANRGWEDGKERGGGGGRGVRNKIIIKTNQTWVSEQFR